jgi:hypothetical protein
MIDKGVIPSIQCNKSFSGPKSMRKVDGLSLISIDFCDPALTPCLNSTENSLLFSENQQRELDRHKVFGAYHLYIYIYIYIYTVQCGGQDGNLGISFSIETLNFRWEKES